MSGKSCGWSSGAAAAMEPGAWERWLAEKERCLRVNPNSLSYPFPLVLRVHVRVRANSGFD